MKLILEKRREVAMCSRWKILVVWVVLLTLTVSTGVMTSPAQEGSECMITVQPGEWIQAAIDKAPEGAVICLAEGEWRENIVIEKSLTLRGQGAQRSVIRARAGGRPVVLISSDEEIRVHIENLTVTGSRDHYGILVQGSARVTIDRCSVFANEWEGIELRDSVQATIWESTISENGEAGITLSKLAQATIEGSTISNNKEDGITLWGSAQATITSSTVSENGNVGVWLGSSAQAVITESTISENRENGIALLGSAQAIITKNIISGNKQVGIYLTNSAQATIIGNVIKENFIYGIFSHSTGEIRGKRNEMRDNGVDLGGNLPGSLRLPLIEPNKNVVIYPNTRYPTIQHAVDALLPGGTLILRGGEYEAGLTITKELTIAAQEKAKVILRARSEDASVLSLVGGAKLEMVGLKVTGGCFGLHLRADAQATIRRSTIFRDRYGIELRDSAQATISETTIS